MLSMLYVRLTIKVKVGVPESFIIIIIIISHNKDYTSITLYKDVARGPQKTTRLVRGGPLVTIILSNRTNIN